MTTFALLFLFSLPFLQAQNPCDSLVPEHCLLPFPNNYYTISDPSTPTGLRVLIQDAAAPLDNRGEGFSFAQWSRLDGFSISSVIATFFANVSLENSNVPGWQNLARSLEADCPTILMDAATGERLPHFAELDHSTTLTTTRAFMIWPIRQLTESRRYIVAIRNLRTILNLQVTPSATFAALRDGTASGDPDIEARRSHFEQNIFAVLTNNGVNRRELQIAWDFTVASEKLTTGGFFTMKEDAATRIPAGGPAHRVIQVQDNYSDRIFRSVTGLMTMPHYLTRNALPGSELVLDSNGMPVYQGEVDVRFTVAIPYACAVAGASCPFIIYGHGLLGSQNQVLMGTQQDVANEYGYIICGVDLWGMSWDDIPSILFKTMTDLGGINIIPDRSHQGMLNQVFLAKLMMGDFRNNEVFNFGGQSVLDPSRRYYWGISQGGILGGMFLAVSDEIDKGHLGVPGSPYPLLLARSVDFDTYFDIIKFRYRNPIDRIMVLSFIGLLWDRAEPSGYLNLVARNPNKRALFDYALGDAQVTFLGAYFMARSMNAKIFRGNVHCHNETVPIYGFDVLESAGPVTEGSVLIGYEYAGIGCGPIENIPPPKETDTHGRPRDDQRNKDNMISFFSTGAIYDFCGASGCQIP